MTSRFGICQACGARNVETLADFGPQPVASHFTREPGAAVPLHRLAFAVCRTCGLAQLARAFPFEDLVPPFDWITYREPEAHLDGIVERIVRLPGVSNAARVAGTTYKDRSTLDRLAARGFPAPRLIDARQDLGATHPHANIETVHGLMTAAKADAIAAAHGQADVLLVRHILEHAASSRLFLEAVARLVRPGGWLVIEVPEVVQNLERQDYAMLWEEHTSYFTAATLPGALAAAGLEVHAIERFDYRFEDVLVAFARRPLANRAIVSVRDEAMDPSRIASSLAMARAYAEAFPGWTAKYQALCERLTADGRRLAAYGAGHLTVAFIELHGLARYFAFVADDTPAKQGLCLPRSGLPIQPGAELDATTISACFMGFTPEIEDKVMARNRAFADAGGQFVSMFVDSPRSLRGLL